MSGGFYDHVGFILKYNWADEVYYVDATGQVGVAIHKWSQLRPSIGSFFGLVSYRKLQGVNDEFIDKTIEFLKEAIGKKYEVSLTQLFL